MLEKFRCAAEGALRSSPAQASADRLAALAHHVYTPPAPGAWERSSPLMDEPIRVEPSRISRAVMFWLVALVLGNLALAVGLWTAPEPVPQSAEPLPDHNLTLISELPAEEREARVADAVPTPVPDVLVCRVWGPFTDPEALAPLRAELETVGSALEVRSSEVAGAPDFLVYVQTGNSLDVARRTLQELETQAIDAYVIAGGPYVNAVSVGVFSTEERATNQQRRVAALGYEVRVEALSRSQTVHHVIARVPESFAVSSADAAPCDAIASLR